MLIPHSNGRLTDDDKVGGQEVNVVDVQVVPLDDVNLPPFVNRARRIEASEVAPVWKAWADTSRIVALPGEPVIRGTALQLKPKPPTQSDLERLAILDLNRQFTSIAAFRNETQRIVQQAQQEGSPIREQPSFPREELRELRQDLRLPPG